MADRVVKVSLIAQVSGYLAGMEKARQATEKTATEADKLAKKRESFEVLGRSALAIGTLAAAGIALAVSKFAEFDKAISAVQAATHESAANMGLLRDAALRAGADTVFTATEAANAIEELGKAGVTTKDILGGGLSGALSLAAAGSLGIAEAASIAAIAMKQFKLEGGDIPHIADLLAAGAGKAVGSVEELAAALNQSGLVANSTGLTIEETTGTLAAFAEAGLLGSDAGTSFKSMLQRLTPISAESKKEMDRLGISAYDASGQFIGMEKFAGNLQTSLKDLSAEQRNAALTQIFGSDAVRAATVLYAQGAEGIANWNDMVNDSGYAAETARLKLDNLAGDVEQLGGSFDTALIKTGSVANDTLRGLTQSVTGMVNAFGSAPEPVQAVALGLGVLTAGVGLLGGGFLTLVPKISATKLAMQDLNLTGLRLAKGFGKAGLVGLALAGVAGAISAIGSESQLAADELAALNAASQKSNLGELGKQFGLANAGAQGFDATLSTLFSDNFWENGSWVQGFNGFVDTVTFGMTDMTQEIDRNKAQFKQLGVQLAATAETDFPKANKQFEKYVELAGGGETAVKQLLEAFPEYKASLIALAAEQGKTLSEQDLLNFAMGKGAVAAQASRDAAARNVSALADMGAAARDTTGDISGLVDELDNFNSSQFTADEAMSAFNQSFLDIQAAIAAVEIDEFGNSVSTFNGTLDESTQAGIDNNRMLRGLAEDANTAAAKVLALGGEQADANAVLETGRARLAEIGGAFGLSGDALQAFIDKYVASPKDLAYQAQVLGLGEAQAAIDRLIANNTGRVLYLKANLQLDNQIRAQVGAQLAFASGGTVTGPGTAKSDSVLIRASAGEEIIQEPYASIYRNQLKQINSGAFPRFADGGTVGRTYVPTPQHMRAPAWAGMGSQSRPSAGINAPISIHEVSDPIGTAMAVVRRLNALAT